MGLVLGQILHSNDNFEIFKIQKWDKIQLDKHKYILFKTGYSKQYAIVKK